MERQTKKDSPPETTLNWGNGTKVSIKQRPYQVTEEQFQALLEKRIEEKYTESYSYDTDENKQAFVMPGNILTFKDKMPGFPKGQVAIAKIERSKYGAIKITNPFGIETPWFATEEELFQAVDWEWMSKKIILKNETE
jgi:hypothetical protein